MKSTSKYVPLAEGQVGAFFQPEVEDDLPKLGPVLTKPDASRRAGTVLDHRWTHPISTKGKSGKRVKNGLYDESQRIYQTGGEIDKFVFWKLKVVSVAYDAWTQVSEKVDWIEIIDHRRNECWRVPMARAKKYLVKYEAGVGKRIGVPIRHWDIVSASGTIRQKGEA